MTHRTFDPDCGLDIATTTIRDVGDLSAIEYFGYRVVLHPDDVLYIHEAYYGADEALLGIARKPAEPCADTHEELAVVLEDMRDALSDSMLTLADLIRDEDDGPHRP